RPLVYVALATGASDSLDGPPASSIRQQDSCVEVRLHIEEGPYSRVIGARPAGVDAVVENVSYVTVADGSRIRILVCPDRLGSRAAYAWVGGRLARLFGPSDA